MHAEMLVIKSFSSEVDGKMSKLKNFEELQMLANGVIIVLLLLL